MWWRIRRGPKVVVTCPACGKQIKKTRARLERNHSLCCPACHLTFRPEPLEVAVAQADAEVSENQD
jgi:peptide subunit release factor 1 (eRF1)